MLRLFVAILVFWKVADKFYVSAEFLVFGEMTLWRVCGCIAESSGGRCQKGDEGGESERCEGRFVCCHIIRA